MPIHSPDQPGRLEVGSCSPSMSSSPSLKELFSLHWWIEHLLTSYDQNPGHTVIELGCIIVILYLIFKKQTKIEKPMSKKEQDALISEWTPEPLLSKNVEDDDGYEEPLVVEGAAGAHVTVGGEDYANFASFNFLSLANTPELKAACTKTIDKYGVGSCGPRGFYGTIDVHEQLEKKVAEFYKMEDAILYSDAIANLPSVIPCFSKAGDIIICDEGANFGIQQGITLSRSSVLWYKHNDMEDLEKTLNTIAEADERNPPTKLTRRFIVVEGISQYHGEIVDLKTVVKLAQKFKYRVILDDSLALGVLGKTGRGSAEHHGIDMKDIAFYCANLDAAIASTGGICTGEAPLIDHQRLSGAGYVFSASSPPFTSTASMVNFDRINDDPQLTSELRKKALLARKVLSGIRGVALVGGSKIPSPVIHLRIEWSETQDSKKEQYAQQGRILRKVRKELLSKHVIVDQPFYAPEEHAIPQPSLRVLVNVDHKNAELESLADLLKAAFKNAGV